MAFAILQFLQQRKCFISITIFIYKLAYINPCSEHEFIIKRGAK